MFWFWRWRGRTRLLSLLHALLLLGMSLLQLLCLLLMALLDLLSSALIGVLSRESLVFFVLSLLKFLPLLLLLRIHLFLLLLIFPVLPGVSGVWGTGSFNGRKISGMHGTARVVIFGRGIVSCCIPRTGISRTAMNSATLAGGNDSAAVKRSGRGSGSNRRLAMVNRGPQLRIGACFLDVLSLRSCGRKAPGV